MKNWFVSTTTILLVVGSLHHANAWYYSTKCQKCVARTTKHMESDYIYTSFFKATDACKDDCVRGCGDRWTEGYFTCMETKFRQDCQDGLAEIATSTTETHGVPCEFGDLEVDRCVDLLVQQRQSCRTTCTATKDPVSGLYKYKSDWNHMSSSAKIWGKCQYWDCDYCEYNKEACTNHVFWLLSNIYGDLVPCPFDACTVQPPDAATDAQIEDCHQDECVMMQEMCVREWRVCHEWCSRPPSLAVPKCDEDLERCLVQYGLFPGPSEETIEACDDAWDACMSSGLYETATCPGELYVETGKATYAGSASCPRVFFYQENGGDHIEEEICGPPEARHSQIYKLRLPDHFDCRLSKVRLEATSRDGWLIKSVQVRVNPKQDDNFTPLFPTEPVETIDQVWLDGLPYDPAYQYQGFAKNSRWSFEAS